MKNIKTYNQVKVGDIAMEHPHAGGFYDHELGKIVWKGTADELRKSKWVDLIMDWETEKEYIDDYDLVIVKMEGDFPDNILFSYDNDPCSCVVFEK